ncbi:NADH-quinone oxidoreductase subunit I [Parapedobacter composti]|uniref:NADH-quinone oxidoreductase subunit I n=1 Tax=Parapedobacter composti TaxID=623281 RepID=A0A1I1K4P7_9SPHI|nr:4Fe-4S binding protein [Parapedobacter composti]SFC52983.1 NADH-quinone oxidoreductase subunit I [Parapedobacter composti]
MFKTALHAFITAVKGLRITLAHLVGARRSRKALDVRKADYFTNQDGVTTVQFPREKMPIPEVARYQLDVEIDDCIVCDLCAKACPVDCITIESIKATDVIGKTSDGSVKRLYAAKFDIDMAKCMYCGLCTVVCPTECITMTDQYDRSTPRLADLTYSFAEMAPEEIAAKKREWAAFQAEKEAAKGR